MTSRNITTRNAEKIVELTTSSSTICSINTFVKQITRWFTNPHNPHIQQNCNQPPAAIPASYWQTYTQRIATIVTKFSQLIPIWFTCTSNQLAHYQQKNRKFHGSFSVSDELSKYHGKCRGQKRFMTSPTPYNAMSHSSPHKCDVLFRQLLPVSSCHPSSVPSVSMTMPLIRNEHVSN